MQIGYKNYNNFAFRGSIYTENKDNVQKKEKSAYYNSELRKELESKLNDEEKNQLKKEMIFVQIASYVGALLLFGGCILGGKYFFNKLPHQMNSKISNEIIQNFLKNSDTPEVAQNFSKFIEKTSENEYKFKDGYSVQAKKNTNNQNLDNFYLTYNDKKVNTKDSKEFNSILNYLYNNDVSKFTELKKDSKIFSTKSIDYKKYSELVLLKKNLENIKIYNESLDLYINSFLDLFYSKANKQNSICPNTYKIYKGINDLQLKTQLKNKILNLDISYSKENGLTNIDSLFLYWLEETFGNYKTSYFA